jgi:very-short-patch-repair endonuclease
MAAPHRQSRAIPRISSETLELRAESHENRALSRALPLAGSICAFQHVRGHGEHEIARLAALQHGHVHRLQFLAAGIGRGAIARRLESGRLHQTLTFVYRLAPEPPAHLGRSMAAALRLRGSALVAGVDSAEIWKYLDTTQTPAATRRVEVLLVARGFHQLPGIQIHRVPEIARQDMRWRLGIPVTSPARTLLDLAATFGDFELEAALAAAFRHKTVRPSQLADVIARNPHAKGVGRLNGLFAHADRPHDTRSGYERRLLALIRDADLPLPNTNAYVGEHMVDMLWPDLKLVVEFDSWNFHGDRRSFETDRLRDQVLSTSDHHVMRVTARQVDVTPSALIARLAATITARRLSR